jgi:hypothetical protein
MVSAQQEAMKLRKEVKSITTQLENAGEERKRLKEKLKVIVGGAVKEEGEEGGGGRGRERRGSKGRKRRGRRK